MRNKSIRNTILTAIMAATILSVSGCQTSQTTADKEKKSSKPAVEMSHSDEYILGEDGCNTCSLLELETAIIPAKNGYYFMENGMLFYYDKETGKTVYACSKPDCKHERYDENCDACVVEYHNKIYLYKDNLYAVGRKNNSGEGTTGLWLTKISEDGSEREGLYCFIHCTDGEGVTYSTYVHRGYLYYSAGSEDVNKKKKITLYRRALEKDAKEEVVYETEGYAAGFDVYNAYGNALYIQESGFNKPDEGERYSKLIKCNIHTKKTEVIKENYWGTSVKIKDKWYVIDEKKLKIVQFTEDGEEKEICPVESAKEMLLKTDGTYLYLYTFKSKDNIVKIIDTDGNLVDTLENADTLIGGDDEYLFFKKYDDEYSEEVGQEVAMEHTYYYKKSDIGSGDYSLRTEMKPE